MQENMTITNISNEEVKVASEPKLERLKYTCLELDCNYKTRAKNHMDRHVMSQHKKKVNEANFICGTCSHEFEDVGNFNSHVKIHDDSIDVARQETVNAVIIEDLLDDSNNVDDRNILTLDEAPEMKSPFTQEKISEAFNCSLCAFTFTGLLDLNSHMEVNHTKKSYSQADADKIQIVPPTIHIEAPPKIRVENSDPNPVTCPFCKLESKNLSGLKTHIENVHGNHETKNNIQDDITSQGNETCTKCPHCIIVGSKSELKEHLASKHAYCDECGNHFFDTKTLNVHILSKHKAPQQSEPFPCELCGLVLVNFSLLQEHVQLFHEASTKPSPISCDKCSVTVDDLSALENHKQTSHSIKEFPCNVCDFKTPLYTDLWKHKMSHEGAPAANIEPGELFMNVIISQQDLILEQIQKSNQRWELQFNDLRLNQDHIYDEIKTLSQTVLSSKGDLLTDLESKFENLSKTFSSLKNEIKSQTKPNHQPPPPSLQKKKILLVGDSLSRNLNISVVRNVTDMAVKRVEAFIVDRNDHKAKIPTKNFMEIVPRELEKEQFSTLILQGGTNEVSNLDVTGNVGEKIELLKEEIKASSVKLFDLAEKSLKENIGLEKVIILKRIFRCDTLKGDPAQIRGKLSEYGNRVLDDIWLTRGCPKNIGIAHQPLECGGDLRISRFGFPSQKDYDGIHLRGKMAVQHYTGSVINVLLKILPNLKETPPAPVNVSTPFSYASVLKNRAPTQQSYFKQKTSSEQANFFKSPFNFAQPKTAPSFAQNPGWQNPLNGKTQKPVPNTQSNQGPGTNKTPLGEGYEYNLNTQNRFASFQSGN